MCLSLRFESPPCGSHPTIKSYRTQNKKTERVGLSYSAAINETACFAKHRKCSAKALRSLLPRARTNTSLRLCKESHGLSS